MMKTLTFLEALEDRIAPASLVTLVNPSTVTYHEADGDDVTVKFSKKVFNDTNAASLDDVFALDNTTGALQHLDLTKLTDTSIAAGTNIIFSVKGSGNGLADVEEIDSSASLGKIRGIHNLASIDIANSDGAKFALKDLDVYSMVKDANTTDLTSTIAGAVGSIAIERSFSNLTLSAPSIDSIEVGLNNKDFNGGVFGTTSTDGFNFGSARKIDLENLAGANLTSDHIGSLHIHEGFAGDGTSTGIITTGTLDRFELGNGVNVGTYLASATVHITSPDAETSFFFYEIANPDHFILQSAGDVQSLTVEGNFTNVQLEAAHFGDVMISQAVGNNDAVPFIHAATMKSFSAGDIRNAQVLLDGYDDAGYTKNGETLGSFTAHGSLINSEILVGLGVPDVRVGNVSIGANWVSSTLSLGAEAGTDGLYGTLDDLASGVSRLDSLTIAGGILGSDVADTSSGILTGQLGKAILNGVNFTSALAALPANSFTVISTPDGGGYGEGAVTLATHLVGGSPTAALVSVKNLGHSVTVINPSTVRYFSSYYGTEVTAITVKFSKPIFTGENMDDVDDVFSFISYPDIKGRLNHLDLNQLSDAMVAAGTDIIFSGENMTRWSNDQVYVDDIDAAYSLGHVRGLNFLNSIDVANLDHAKIALGSLDVGSLGFSGDHTSTIAGAIGSVSVDDSLTNMVISGTSVKNFFVGNRIIASDFDAGLVFDTAGTIVITGPLASINGHTAQVTVGSAHSIKINGEKIV